MAVSIRLSRGGAKKRPFYRIVAADTRAPRDGRFIEKLGIYNPMLPREHPDRVVMKTERVQYWLSVGAKPTDRVARFLGLAGLADGFSPSAQTKKDKPKAKALERMREKEEARKAAEEAAAEAAAAAAEAAAGPSDGASDGDGAEAAEAGDTEA